MNLSSQIFFNDINYGYLAAILKESSLWLLQSYMAVATYCYYKNVRRTMRTAIVSYFLKTLLYRFKELMAVLKLFHHQSYITKVLHHQGF